MCRLPYRTPALAAGTLNVQSGSAAPASRDTNHPCCGSIGHRRDGNSRIPCQTTTARELRRLCEQNPSTSTIRSLRSGSLSQSAELGLALRPIQPSLGHSAATLPCGRETRSLTTCPLLAIRRRPVRQVHTRSIQPVLADGLTKRAWDTPARRTCQGSRHGSAPRSSAEVRGQTACGFDRFPLPPGQAEPHRHAAPSCDSTAHVIAALSTANCSRMLLGRLASASEEGRSSPGGTTMGQATIDSVATLVPAKLATRPPAAAPCGAWQMVKEASSGKPPALPWDPARPRTWDSPKRGPAGETTEVDDPQVTHCQSARSTPSGEELPVYRIARPKTSPLTICPALQVAPPCLTSFQRTAPSRHSGKPE